MADKLTTIETDALPARAMDIVAEALGYAFNSAHQGGRLGTELSCYGEETARTIADALKRHGYKAWR